MKLFLSILFLFFYPLSSQSQQYILIEDSSNLDTFDWLAFSNQSNVDTYINFRNESFGLRGTLPLVIDDMNYDKKQLIQLEQELALYKQEIKANFPGDIQAAKKAIDSHWEGIKRVEDKIRSIGFGEAAQAARKALDLHLKNIKSVESVEDKIRSIGFGDAAQAAADYRDGVWELYQADHDIILGLVDKKDEDLYKLLGEDDEAYAEFISPSIERYTISTKATAQAYFNFWESFPKLEKPFRIDNNMSSLMEMYRNSLEISNCFNKNFKNPTGDRQQALVGNIQGLYTQQSQWGSEVFITTYKDYALDPKLAIDQLNTFYTAPQEVREKIARFYREEILNNEKFIQTENRYLIGSRVRALIGLKRLDMLNEEEKKLFKKAIEEGIIKDLDPEKPEASKAFSPGRSKSPLP